MTVTTTDRKDKYEGDGAQDTFQYTFKIASASDMQVTHTDASDVDTLWVYQTQYEVTGAGELTGGNVVVGGGYIPAEDEYLTLARVTAIVQPSNYVENSDFAAETLETDFDRAIMILQELAEKLDRVLLISIIDDGGASLTIPNITDRASKYLWFDASGNATAKAGTAVGGDHGLLGAASLLDDDHTQYLLRTDFTTSSGDILSYVDDNFYTSTQVDTLVTTSSGDIITYIDSEITTVNNTITTTSGDILTYVDNNYYTSTETDTLITTVSGDIITIVNDEALLQDGSTPLTADWDYGSDTISGTGHITTGDHPAAAVPAVSNIIYGTTSNPPVGASTVPEGTVYFSY